MVRKSPMKVPVNQILLALLIGLGLLTSYKAGAETGSPNADAAFTVSGDRSQLMLGGRVLLEAKADGFRSILAVQPSPTGGHALVIACGFECTDNIGFVLNAEGSEKRKFTAAWDYILQAKAEWSEDGQWVFYYRVNSTGADPPPKAPRKGWVQVNVKTGKKSPATARTLKLNATYGIVSLSGHRTLKVYAEPRPKAPIAGTLPSYAKGIQVTGTGVKVGKETWVPVRFQSISGWVNQDFLFEESGAG